LKGLTKVDSKMNDMYQNTKCKQILVEKPFVRSQTDLDNCYTQLCQSCTEGLNWLEDEYTYVRKKSLTKGSTASAIPGICTDDHRGVAKKDCLS